MRANPEMAPHQPPVRAGYKGQQRMDIGISQPRALLATGTIQKCIGRAKVQRTRSDAPDLGQPDIITIESRVIAARIAPLDRSDLLHLGTTARYGCQISKSHRIKRFDAFEVTAAEHVAHRVVSWLEECGPV